jgi:cell division protein FtsI (penicillin-binding protein 3)
VKPIDLRVEGDRQGAIETARNRIIFVMALFSLGFMSLVLKLISVGVFQASSASYYQSANVNTSLLMARADIVDRNGVILATNLKSPSLAVVRKNLKTAPEELAKDLSSILPELSYNEALEILKTDRNHHWIKRNLTPRQLFEIRKIGDPGLVTSDAEKRIYPHGRLAAHVLGSVDFDNMPSSGIELYFNERLANPEYSEQPLVLSLDLRLQHILNQELNSSMEKFSAKGAAGIIMDVSTGEVLALTSLPDFDPNDTDGPQTLTQMNKILQGVYELGSGFKTFTIAAGLDFNVVGLSDGYDATKPVRIGRFTIHDDHPKGRWLNIPEIFAYSSNIGTLKLAQDIGVERQQEFFDKLGLFRKADIEINEKSAPLLPSQWGPTELATTSYGHGIAVTPLHMVNGIAAMVNGGRLNPATLLRKNMQSAKGVTSISSVENPDTGGKQVISPKTSEIMRNMLHLAVEHGTGKNAKVDGYLIGGKTGTADKVINGQYSKRAVISSFISVFPIDQPKYVVFAMLDEPQGIEETFNLRTAGMTAAPMVGNIIRRVGPMMGIKPTETEEIEYEKMILVSDSE